MSIANRSGPPFFPHASLSIDNLRQACTTLARARQSISDGGRWESARFVRVCTPPKGYRRSSPHEGHVIHRTARAPIPISLRLWNIGWVAILSSQGVLNIDRQMRSPHSCKLPSPSPPPNCGWIPA